jgi:multimeric flavodoxin WrbA
MTIVIFDGAPRDGRSETCRRLAAMVAGEARTRGHAATVLELDGLTIKPCRGCFACWLKHPGTCAIKDDQELVLRAEAASDVEVWITPVVFGGYGASLKKALDRSIPNILPYFTKTGGEVHHPRRYEKRRTLLVLGTLPSPDAEAERIFHDLVTRNAINLWSSITRSLVITEGMDETAARARLRASLDDVLEAR